MLVGIISDTSMGRRARRLAGDVSMQSVLDQLEQLATVGDGAVTFRLVEVGAPQVS